MKHNMFGEQQPESFNDLVEIKDEYGFDPKKAYVTVADGTLDNEKGSNFYGWCAEISAEVEEDGESDTKEFNTCAWPSKDELLADLIAAGFGKIEIEVA